MKRGRAPPERQSVHAPTIGQTTNRDRRVGRLGGHSLRPRTPQALRRVRVDELDEQRLLLEQQLLAHVNRLAVRLHLRHSGGWRVPCSPIRARAAAPPSLRRSAAATRWTATRARRCWSCSSCAHRREQKEGAATWRVAVASPGRRGGRLGRRRRGDRADQGAAELLARAGHGAAGDREARRRGAAPRPRRSRRAGRRRSGGSPSCPAASRRGSMPSRSSTTCTTGTSARNSPSSRRPGPPSSRPRPPSETRPSSHETSWSRTTAPRRTQKAPKDHSRSIKSSNGEAHTQSCG